MIGMRLMPSEIWELLMMAIPDVAIHQSLAPPSASGGAKKGRFCVIHSNGLRENIKTNAASVENKSEKVKNQRRF